jgi:hypothetical protein
MAHEHERLRFKSPRGSAGLMELVCIYGYALTVFIPAAIICIVSLEI